MSTVGVQRLCLKQLHTKITNSLIVGVIIAKQPCRIFEDKKGGSRGVWNFTLRDSETDYINATCWGRAEYAMYLDNTFHVGDVVDVIDARIDIRHIDDSGEQYRPAVTSPFNLTLNENISGLIIHEGDNYSFFLKFLHIPTKALAACLTLGDIKANGSTMREELVDLLVIVKQVKPVRKVLMKKDGQEKEITDLTVLDLTYNEMNITIWDQDMIQRSKNWKRCQTVLYLADMRIDWSQFHKGMVIAFTSRSVVIEDPITPAADELRDFAKKAPLTVTAYLDEIASKIPSPNLANSKVMSCRQILDKAELDSEYSVSELQCTAVVYAFVMQLDLDGYGRIISTRCGRCSTFINSYNELKQCTNLECPVGSGAEHPVFDTFFDIPVILADHSASLVNCKLSGKTAEKVLGLTVQHFEMLSSEEREALKWRFLLQRCVLHIMVFKTSKNYEPFISILSCNVADTDKFQKNLRFY